MAGVLISLLARVAGTHVTSTSPPTTTTITGLKECPGNGTAAGRTGLNVV